MRKRRPEPPGRRKSGRTELLRQFTQQGEAKGCSCSSGRQHDTVWARSHDGVVRKAVQVGVAAFQRPARDHFLKACNKLGLPVSSRKRLVDESRGSGKLNGRLGHLCHQRKKSANILSRTTIFTGSLGWSVGPLQHFRRPLGFLMSSRRAPFAVLREVYGAIHEHIEDGWMKVTPSLLLDVLSCCLLRRPSSAAVTSSFAGGSAA